MLDDIVMIVLFAISPELWQTQYAYVGKLAIRERMHYLCVQSIYAYSHNMDDGR